MKLYLASSIKNVNKVHEIKKMAQKFGHEVTSRWEEYLQERLTAAESQYRDWAIADMFEGLDECDALVLILPIGRGAHIELGYAVAKNKKIFVLSDDVKTDVLFYRDSRVNWVASPYELLKVIDKD